jgi:Flp pilus assembly protein TadG
VEALVFGLLVLVLGTLVLGDAWAVLDAKMAAAGAARQAARALVQAPAGADPLAVADSAAVQALSAEGRDPARRTVRVQGSLDRCSRVTVTVSYRVALVAVPLLGQLGGYMPVSASQSELVDPYRSGLPGTAECPP